MQILPDLRGILEDNLLLNADLYVSIYDMQILPDLWGLLEDNLLLNADLYVSIYGMHILTWYLGSFGGQFVA